MRQRLGTRGIRPIHASKLRSPYCHFLTSGFTADGDIAPLANLPSYFMINGKMPTYGSLIKSAAWMLRHKTMLEHVITT